MGVSDVVQRKVIEISQSKFISDLDKMSLKKEFYNLKYKEIELGEMEYAFQQTVNTYERKLDTLRASLQKSMVDTVDQQMNAIPQQQYVAAPQPQQIRPAQGPVRVSVQPNLPRREIAQEPVLEEDTYEVDSTQ